MLVWGSDLFRNRTVVARPAPLWTRVCTSTQQQVLNDRVLAVLRGRAAVSRNVRRHDGAGRSAAGRFASDVADGIVGNDALAKRVPETIERRLGIGRDEDLRVGA